MSTVKGKIRKEVERDIKEATASRIEQVLRNLRGIYTVRDTRTGVYNLPFFCLTELEALRHFERLAKDPNSMVHFAPSDYDLFQTGTFDDQNGKIDAFDTPRHVKKAIDFTA